MSAPGSRQEHKIVILGSMGAGKSTLVRTVASGNVIDTDVENTDAASDKLATTVAMDYADVDLPNGDRMRLYGTPGQARFDFIWPILLEGARGVVVLIDAASRGASDELDLYLGSLARHAPDVPTVVGLSKVDLLPDVETGSFAAVMAARDARLPLVPIDARERGQILMLMDILMTEIETRELMVSHG